MLLSVSLIFDVSTVSEHELLLFERKIVDREKNRRIPIVRTRNY